MSASHSRRAAVGKRLQAMEKIGQMTRQVGEAGFWVVGTSVFARRGFGSDPSDAHAKILPRSTENPSQIDPRWLKSAPKRPMKAREAPKSAPNRLMNAPTRPMIVPRAP